jgi:hypothetical protein
VNDMDGTLQVHHTGSLAGMYSFVSLFPELDLGFVVLTNQQSSAARSALMYSVMKPYLGDTQTDWLAQFSPKPHPVERQTVSKKGSSNFQLASIKTKGNKDYIGVYDDPWLGRFIIENQEDGALQVHSIRVEKLIGSLYEVDKDSLLIRWHDRSLEADAIISFIRNNKGDVSGMTMAAESNDIDFSYDFQDLDFTKVASP